MSLGAIAQLGSALNNSFLGRIGHGFLSAIGLRKGGVVVGKSQKDKKPIRLYVGKGVKRNPNRERLVHLHKQEEILNPNRAITYRKVMKKAGIRYKK